MMLWLPLAVLDHVWLTPIYDQINATGQRLKNIQGTVYRWIVEKLKVLHLGHSARNLQIGCMTLYGPGADMTQWPKDHHLLSHWFWHNASIFLRWISIRMPLNLWWSAGGHALHIYCVSSSSNIKNIFWRINNGLTIDHRGELKCLRYTHTQMDRCDDRTYILHVYIDNPMWYQGLKVGTYYKWLDGWELLKITSRGLQICVHWPKRVTINQNIHISLPFWFLFDMSVLPIQINAHSFAQ